MYRAINISDINTANKCVGVYVAVCFSFAVTMWARLITIRELQHQLQPTRYCYQGFSVLEAKRVVVGPTPMQMTPSTYLQFFIEAPTPPSTSLPRLTPRTHLLAQKYNK